MSYNPATEKHDGKGEAEAEEVRATPWYLSLKYGFGNW